MERFKRQIKVDPMPWVWLQLTRQRSAVNFQVYQLRAIDNPNQILNMEGRFGSHVGKLVW